MPHPLANSKLRLRVLLHCEEVPQWQGKLLLALDGMEGVALQVFRLDTSLAPATLPVLSRLWRARITALAPWTPDVAASQQLAQWEAAAMGECDATLALDASLCPAPSQAGGARLQWAVVDGAGQALCRQFPLLVSICTGQGLSLALNQRSSVADSWHPRRWLRLGITTNYARGLDALPNAVRRLVQQAIADHMLDTAATPHRVDAPSASICASVGQSDQWPWLIGMWGAVHAVWNRLKVRLLSEYWRIGVVDAPIHTLLDSAAMPKVRWLTQANTTGYWADPFGLPDDPQRLVCEYFDERTGLGNLEVLRLDSAAAVVERIRLRVGAGRHASFPHVFELNGRHLGVAETLSTRECLLYEVNAAGHWHPLYPLLRDVAAADPSLFTWGGRLWLAYTDTDLGTMDNLCLQYADRLEGPWTPHANNPVKVDIASARMAGGFFWHKGALYRPAQNCLHTYGGALVVHRIEELSPFCFSEVIVRALSPDAKGPCPHGLHTLNAWGERTLIDGKYHGVNLIALWRNLRRRLSRGKVHSVLPQQKDVAVCSGPTRRVLVYVPHLRTGGGEISMLRLAEGLATAGLQVDLVAHSMTTCELEVPMGVNLINLNSSGTATAVWRLSKLLRERKPHWVLSAFPHTNIAAVAALALSGVDSRCVISEHAPLSLQIEQQGNWRYRLLPPLVRWAYRRASAVVAVSAGVRDDLQRLIGPRVVPQVICNPVLAGNFEAELALVPVEPWLTDDTLKVVLSVGRLSVEKDLVTLVHAFAEVHRHRSDTRLLLAGEGPDRQRLASLVSELGLDGVVRLPGRTSSPLAWMRHAAVFVLASQYEGFGNVLVEAMACGTPVVSTDCPVGPREILEAGRLGTLVPVGDAPAMARAIEAVLVQRVPLPGAREAALRYTQTNACAAYLALFDRLYPGGATC